MREYSYPVHNRDEPDVSPPTRVRWPFPTMKVGQFFVVPEQARHKSCRAAASQYGSRNFKEFSCTSNVIGELVVRRES